MLSEILKSLGWIEKEAIVYLTLLENGSLIVSDIAKLSKVNRVTVYDILEKLIERGAVSLTQTETRKFYTASNPEFIYRVEKEKVSNFHKNLEKFKDLSTKKKTNNVRFFEGEQSLNILLEDLKESKDKIIKCFLAPKDVYSNMPELVEKYIETRIKNNYTVHAIMPDLLSTREFKKSQKEERRVIKFVSDKKFNFNTSFYCTNSKLYIVDFQGSINSILIEDKSISESLESIFDMCWDLLS
tara:strand:+ start:1051 stop:1776 length:726 start_codon:yes stop_codon:yes gene_type:complete